MKIESINFGQSFEDGVPRWQKCDIQASPEPGETPEQVLSQIKTIIDEWHKSANPHLYSTTYGAASIVPTSSGIRLTDEEIESAKRGLDQFEYREDALDYIAKIGFRYNVELNKIANSKPTKNV